MKSVGEIMSIGRGFEEAFQKALRMMNENLGGFDPYVEEFTEQGLSSPTDKRMLVLANALKRGVPVKEIYELTKIDKWFLYKFARIIKHLNVLEQVTLTGDRCSSVDTAYSVRQPSVSRCHAESEDVGIQR